MPFNVADSHFWGGMAGRNGRSKYYKITMTPCSGGDIVSFYCECLLHLHPQRGREPLFLGFMPSELTKHHQEGFEFKEVPVEEILQGNYNELDPDCANLLRHSFDRMPWRLYVHQPYEAWHKGKACILGDAAHPMTVSYTHPSVPSTALRYSLARSATPIPRGMSGYRRCRSTRHHLL